METHGESPSRADQPPQDVETVRAVLAAYGLPGRPWRAEPLANAGGFSGARLWRVSAATTPNLDPNLSRSAADAAGQPTSQASPIEGKAGPAFCLRRWPPEHPSAQQLLWIHHHLSQAAALPFVPQLCHTADGASFVDLSRRQQADVDLSRRRQAGFVSSEAESERDVQGGVKRGLRTASQVHASQVHAASQVHTAHLWELTTWLPGAGDFAQHPNAERVVAAVQALAQLHLIWHDAPTGQAGWEGSTPGKSAPSRQPSPGLAARRSQVQQAIDQRWSEKYWPTIDHRHGVEVAAACWEMLRLVPPWLAVARGMLETISDHALLLQPCLRDIWCDHVLFSENKVTGLVDYGAMRVDSVAGDLARLLGTMVVYFPEAWGTGLRAYAAIRPLSQQEVLAAQAFDRSSVPLSALNWIRWLYIEHRVFGDRDRVVERLRSLVCRLQQPDGSR